MYYVYIYIYMILWFIWFYMCICHPVVRAFQPAMADLQLGNISICLRSFRERSSWQEIKVEGNWRKIGKLWQEQKLRNDSTWLNCVSRTILQESTVCFNFMSMVCLLHFAIFPACSMVFAVKHCATKQCKGESRWHNGSILLHVCILQTLWIFAHIEC